MKNFLPQNLKDILIGLLLGDAHISKSKTKDSYISFEQGINNQEYLYFIYELFKDYSKNLPTEYKRFDKRYNKENISIYFRTINSPIFNEFTQIFLDLNGNKIIPYTLYDYLTPKGLAFWLMDDGQYVKRGGITLCTDSFTKEEVFFLKEILEKKFNLKCSIHNKNPKLGYYRIYISKTSLVLLRSLVKEYFHSSMLYKLDD